MIYKILRVLSWLVLWFLGSMLLVEFLLLIYDAASFKPAAYIAAVIAASFIGGWEALPGKGI